MQVEGKIAELVLLDGFPAARILCPPRLIPVPGCYLMAHADGSDAPLANPIFSARSLTDGFLAAPPAPDSWRPGTSLHLRGPLGRGFTLPASARRVALVALSDSPRRLLALLDAAFEQEASITLMCEHPPEDLSLQVEVQPIEALAEVCQWADYMAFEARRESLPELREKNGKGNSLKSMSEAQVLVNAPMPCGGLAECRVCTVEVHGGHRLACVDGPVFKLSQLVG